MWYPIDGESLPVEPKAGSDNVPVAARPADAPAAEELQDWIQSEKDLMLSEALSLGFAPLSLNQGGTHRTIVLDAMRYVDMGNVR